MDAVGSAQQHTRSKCTARPRANILNSVPPLRRGQTRRLDQLPLLAYKMYDQLDPTVTTLWKCVARLQPKVALWQPLKRIWERFPNFHGGVQNRSLPMLFYSHDSIQTVSSSTVNSKPLVDR